MTCDILKRFMSRTNTLKTNLSNQSKHFKKKKFCVQLVVSPTILKNIRTNFIVLHEKRLQQKWIYKSEKFTQKLK